VEVRPAASPGSRAAAKMSSSWMFCRCMFSRSNSPRWASSRGFPSASSRRWAECVVAHSVATRLLTTATRRVRLCLPVRAPAEHGHAGYRRGRPLSRHQMRIIAEY
jgi:hypothetical protein